MTTATVAAISEASTKKCEARNVDVPGAAASGFSRTSPTPVASGFSRTSLIEVAELIIQSRAQGRVFSRSSGNRGSLVLAPDQRTAANATPAAPVAPTR